MKKLHLKESCTIYGSVTRTRYGDLQLNGGTTELCSYRNIEQLNRGINFREDVQIQGLFWFDATTVAKKGSVVQYNGQLYRIENVVTAKQLLTSNAVHFVKCQVSLYRAIS